MLLLARRRHHILAAAADCGSGFGAEHPLAGEILQALVVALRMVVETVSVECTAAEEVVGGADAVASGRDEACRVDIPHELGHMPGQKDVRIVLERSVGIGVVDEVEEKVGLGDAEVLEIVVDGVALLADLVSDAPHDDRRMVAVPSDEVLQVGDVPLVEEAGVVERRLALAPHVERFIHDEETHLVADLEKLGSRGIVRCPDGVAAHLLEGPDLALQGPVVYCGTDAAHVVMQADAQHLDRFAVEEDTLHRVPFYGAESEGCVIIVDGLSSDADLGNDGVKVWRFDAPEVRRIDIKRGVGDVLSLFQDDVVAH